MVQEGDTIEHSGVEYEVEEISEAADGIVVSAANEDPTFEERIQQWATQLNCGGFHTRNYESEWYDALVCFHDRMPEIKDGYNMRADLPDDAEVVGFRPAKNHHACTIYFNDTSE